MIRPARSSLAVVVAAAIAAALATAACGASATPSTPAPGGASMTPPPIASPADPDSSPGPSTTPSAPTPTTVPAATPSGPFRLAVVVGPIDGTTITLLTVTDGEVDGPAAIIGAGDSPAWSPDGRRIAFTCRHDPNQLPGLCMADLDDPGAGPRVVLPEVVSVTWSPTGEQLALGRSAIDFGNTVLAKPDGTGATELVLPDYELRADLWSPDGTQLAGAASYGGATAPVVAVCSATRGACRVLGPGMGLAWSPDGSAILAATGAGAGSRLVAVDAATGDRTLVAELGSPVSGAAWSGSGRIAVVLEDGAILVIDAAGSVPRVVAPDLRCSGAPTWSPDGRWIAVREGTSPTSDLYLVDADGPEVVRLTQGGDGRSAAWAPGG